MALNSLGLGFTIGAKDAASSVFKDVNAALGGTTKAAEEASRELEKVGAKMKLIGTVAIGAGLAVGAGLGGAAMAASKFEKGITEVSTLVDHAKFSLGDMEDLTQDMAMTYGGDLSTQVSALYQGISAGANTAAKAQGLLTGANKLSVAGHTDQTTAILGLTKVLNNYNLDFGKATEVSDAFFVAVKGGATTVGELGNAVGEVAGAGRALGIGYEELIAIIGTGATLTRDTAGATTGLKAALQGIVHPTSEATEEAARLGIKFNAAHLSQVKFGGMLKEITSSAKFNAQSLNKLFSSIEAGTLIQALAANGGQALTDMMDSMKNKAGGTDQAFQEMNGTLDQQVLQLKATAEVIAVRFGDVMLPVLKDTVAVFKDIGKSIADMNPNAQRAIVVAAALAAVTLVVVGGMLLLGGAIMGIVAVWPAIVSGFAIVTPILYTVAGWIAVLSLALYAFKQAYDTNLGGFADMINGVYTKGKLAFTGLVQLFSSGEFSMALWKELNGAGMGGVKDFVITVFLWGNRLKNFFVGISDGFSLGIASLGPTFTMFTDSLRRLGSMFGLVQDGPDQAKGKWLAFGAMGKRVGDILADVIGWIVRGFNLVLEVVNEVIDGFQRSGPTLSSWGTTVDIVVGSVMDLVSAFTHVEAGGDKSGNLFSELGRIVGWLGGVFAQVTLIVGLAIGIVVGVIAAGVRGIIGTLRGLWLVFSGIWDMIGGLLTMDSAKMWQGYYRVVFGVVKMVLAIIGTMVEGIASMIDNVGKKFGKNFGLAATVREGSDAMLKDLERTMGDNMKHSAAVTTAAPVAGPPPPTTSPSATGPTTALPEVGIPRAGGPLVSSAPMMSTMPAAAPMQATPINLNQSVQLTLDGDKLAEWMQKKIVSGEARTFTPTKSVT
jgi:TP901 family phage tail tape measure protein